MFFIWCFCCRWHVIVSIDGDVCDDGYDDDDEDEDDDDDDDHDDDDVADDDDDDDDGEHDCGDDVVVSWLFWC